MKERALRAALDWAYSSGVEHQILVETMALELRQVRQDLRAANVELAEYRRSQEPDPKAKRV